MKMKTLLVALCGLILSTGLRAQVNETERIEQARKRWQALEKAWQPLGEPPIPSYLELPVPDPRGLQLAHQLYLFATEYADLDLAPGAWLNAAKLLRSLGDPTRALDFAKNAAEHAKSVESQKIEARDLRVQIYSEGGGHAFAVAELESLKNDFPEHRLVPGWESRQAKEQEETDRKRAVAGDFLRALQSPDANAAARASQNLRRFLVNNPLAPEAPTAFLMLFERLGEDPPMSAQLPILERISLYAPDHEQWPAACGTTVREMARDGEYEVALLHAHRAIARASSLPASTQASMNAVVGQILQKLGEIALRDLDLKPITKRTRLADIRRRGRRASDPEILAELVQDFRSDYPGASELKELRFLEARARESRDKESALALYRQVAGDDRGGPFGFQATERATALIEELEDANAAATFLGAQLEAYAQDPDRGWSLSLDQAKRLDRLDRWEEARQILKPWKDQLQGLDLQHLESLDAALAEKLGN